jgi:hypothetical protein
MYQSTHLLRNFRKLYNIYNHHTHITKNTENLTNELASIEINADTIICSLDITNMYINIPTDKIIHIITTITNNNYTDEDITHEIISSTIIY